MKTTSTLRVLQLPQIKTKISSFLNSLDYFSSFLSCPLSFTEVLLFLHERKTKTSYRSRCSTRTFSRQIRNQDIWSSVCLIPSLRSHSDLQGSSAIILRFHQRGLAFISNNGELLVVFLIIPILSHFCQIQIWFKSDWIRHLRLII